MAVKFEKTAAGEVAILPRAEYEALLAKADEFDEDKGTARLIERGRQEIESGAPLLPLHVVDRLADGENAARVLREWRGLTQVDLAAHSKLSQGYISDIESGRRTGTPAVLRQIADALQVPLDLLA
ncbi:MAG: helix-turn-helix domain-containing protein [Devosia sp.]